MKKTFFFSFILLTLFSGCKQEPDYLDLEPYFYPYKMLEEGLVYEYQQVGGESADTEYWFFKSVKDENGWHLTGNFYDQHFNVSQFYRQDIYENGSLYKDYFIYAVDSMGVESRFDAAIKSPNAFPFHLKDTTSILVSEMTWTFSETPKHQTTLVRNRQYKGSEQFKFKGENKEAVSFNIRELVDDEAEGHLETEYKGIEIYVKDIGLVYYHKELNDQLNLQYSLKDIYPMSTLEEKFKSKNEAQ